MIPDDLRVLVSNSFGEQEAQALGACELSDADMEALKTAVREVFIVAKPVPGACVLMSALVKFRLEALTKTSAYVVAGTLAVNDKHAFGTADSKVDDKTFSGTNLDWDGHCWVQFGKYIVDISLRRTVASGKAPPVLAVHIRAKSGENTGALIGTDEAMREDGLVYKPLRVLTQAELDPLINGALVTFVGKK